MRNDRSDRHAIIEYGGYGYEHSPHEAAASARWWTIVTIALMVLALDFLMFVVIAKTHYERSRAHGGRHTLSTGAHQSR